MHALFSGIRKAFCLGMIALLFAGCGGGGSGGSSTGGFTADGDSIRFGGVRVEKSLLPANLNLEQPSLLLPYTTAVIFKVERRNDGSEVPDGTPVQVTVEGVKHGGISVLNDPATDEDEFSNLMGSLSTETSGGLVRVFFTSFSEPGEATIIASVQDPVSGNNKIAKATIRVTSDQRPVAALTFTGPFVNAVLTGATRFGDGTVQNGAYSRVLGVIAADADGNPVNPGTQINFFLIDGPLTGYPESGTGAFFVAGNNGDPLEGENQFDALDGNFVSKGVLPFDRLVLDGGQRSDNPVPDNRFHTGIRVVENVASQTTLFIQEPPFNMGPDNGPTVPYLIGRSQSGTILSPSFTDVNGVAETLLTYPVSRLGQTAILVACTSDSTVCTVLNTCDATGANCGSVYLGASDGSNVSLTTSVPQGQQLKANSSTDVTLCLKDPNFAPLPATSIDYAIGNTGAATVTVNGNSATVGTLNTGGDGCVTVPVASSGQVPGSQPVPVSFDADGVATPVTLEIAAPGDGNLTGMTNCSIDQEKLTGQCTVNLLLTDDNGSPLSGVMIGLQDPPGDPFTINFSPASGGFGVTNDQGRVTATINLQGPGDYGFTFATQSGTATFETAEISIEDTGSGGGGGGDLAITTASLPNGTVGVFYSALLEAEGGKQPLTWSLENGSLPQGIKLDAATGTLSGTPSVPGTSNFTARVTDADQQFSLKPFTIEVVQGSDGGGGGVAVNDIQLLVSSPELPSSGNDPVTLTAVVRDANNNVVKDVQVTFSADNDGTIQVTRGTTDETGTAQALLSTGGNKENREINVTTSVGDLSDSTTVKVTGTTIAISGSDSVSVGDSVPLLITLTDSSGAGIINRTLSVESAAGNPIESSSLTTDFDGQVEIEVKANNIDSFGTVSGDLITISGAGAEAKHTISISPDSFVFIDEDGKPLSSSAAGPVLEIPLKTSTSLKVRWLENGTPTTKVWDVKFTTTRGESVSVNPVKLSGGKASVSMRANSAGRAVVTATVDNPETAKVDGPSTQITVLFVATEPDDFVVQADPATVGPNEKSTVKVIVFDSEDNLVKNVPVQFTLFDVTGGTLSTAQAVTDESGEAKTIYTAGPTSSAKNAVQITATVGGASPSTKTVKLTVGEKSLFITLGTGNTIFEPNPTTYEYPFSVLVTDAVGGPLAGARVTLNIVPVTYIKGDYFWNGTVWQVLQSSRVECQNEDLNNNGIYDPFTPVSEDRNNNGILDQGEDWNSNGQIDLITNEDRNQNGELDQGEDLNGNGKLDDFDQNNNGRLEPGNVVTLSTQQVTTDASGFAFFNLLYAQEFANWVRVKLTAQASVAGSEALEISTFIIPASAEDLGDEKVNPPGRPSPFGDGSKDCSFAER